MYFRDPVRLPVFQNPVNILSLESILKSAQVMSDVLVVSQYFHATVALCPPWTYFQTSVVFRVSVT